MQLFKKPQREYVELMKRVHGTVPYVSSFALFCASSFILIIGAVLMSYGLLFGNMSMLIAGGLLFLMSMFVEATREISINRRMLSYIVLKEIEEK